MRGRVNFLVEDPPRLKWSCAPGNTGLRRPTPVCSRRAARPFFESPVKGGGIVEADLATDYCDRDAGLGQTLNGHISAQLVLDSLEGGAFLGEAAG